MKNRKRVVLCIIALLCLLVIVPMVVRKKSTTLEIKKIDTSYSGDSKLYKHYIVSTHDKDGLELISINDMKKRISIKGIRANWVSCLDEEGVIVYANFNNEIGLIQLDQDNKVIQKKILFKKDQLSIDPCIIKVEDTYYLTVTNIEGNVNNADLSKENGIYTVEMYTSKDLMKWNKLINVMKEKHNIEDVDLLMINNKLSMVYERETVDKGKSSIMVIQSNDKGKTWGRPIQLIEANADNEPGTIEVENNNIVIHYSSDKENPGKSYNGANIYRLDLSSKFKKIEEEKISVPDKSGKLLYDVKKIGTNNYYLFSEDYITENRLTLLTK